MTVDNNNNPLQAVDLGILAPANARDGSFFSASRFESVNGADDRNDFYKLRLDTTANLNVSLSGITSSSGAIVNVFRNINNNTSIDPTAGELVKSVLIRGSVNSFRVDGLGRGDYGIRVSNVGTTTATDYSLNVSSTVGTGQEQGITDFLNPQDLDSLNGSRLISGAMNGNTAPGGDIQDFYRFRVDVPTKFEASLFTSTAATTDFNLFKIDNDNSLRFSSFSVNSNVDSVQVDYLPTGTYLIAPRAVGSNTNYTLSLNGTPIDRAEASLTVERIRALDEPVSFDGPFDPIFGSHKADFFTEVSIEGDKKTSKKVNNDNDIQPNFTHTRLVNVNDQFIGFRIAVKDSDDVFDDEADINDGLNFTDFRDVFLPYNPVKNEVTGFFPRFLGRKGESITIEGDGIEDDTFSDNQSLVPRARVTFRVDYNTFGFGQTSFSNSTPTTIGTNTNQSLTGQSGLSGIFDGRGGRDRIFTRDGDDVAMGGAGNDTINAGTGDDILLGGLGKDILISGLGRDTFVLSPDTGVDIIRDFRNGKDQLGLTYAIAFEMLDIVQRGRNTVIGLGDERLAVLKGVRANLIGAEDFVAIDFTSFKRMEVPTIAA